jgi:enoyl-[acyl-carrier protein] reductase I
MTAKKPDWTVNKDIAVGKGATFQQWVATVDKAKFEMDVAPWGEGHLRVCCASHCLAVLSAPTRTRPPW